MGRKQHPSSDGPRFRCNLIGIAIHVVKAGQVLHVDILPRDRAGGDRKIARLAHGHPSDVDPALGARENDRFDHIARAKAAYRARPFALRARKTKPVHQTHLASLAARRRDEQRHDALHMQHLWRGGTDTRRIEPMRLGQLACSAIPLGPASSAHLDG